MSSTVFGGKSTYDFWKTIFATGRTPDGIIVLSKPLNVADMIRNQGGIIIKNFTIKIPIVFAIRKLGGTAIMVTRKEDTSRKVARRKYEEKNKELRKEKSANFQTMIPRELFEEISAFLTEKGITKVDFIKS